MKNLIHDKILFKIKNYIKCFNKNCDYFLVKDENINNINLYCENCG